VAVKYIAPVELSHEELAATPNPDVDDVGDLQIVDLAGAEYDVVQTGSRRWAGVLVGIAVAVTGFGFVCHGSGLPARDPVGAGSKIEATAAAIQQRGLGANAGDGTALALDDRLAIITAPAEGMTVTSGVTMTGGVVVVDADARRVLGSVHASVAFGELVLGSRDVNVQAVGQFEFRIPVFPPPFDAPVVLRMHAAPPDVSGGLDLSRDFLLNIPSVVGFWDTSSTGIVDAGGRAQILVRGYGPLSARTMDIAIRDPRGRVLSTRSVRLAVVADAPGSVAGHAFGLGSFEVGLALPAGAADPLLLYVTWRDPATGDRLHMETALPDMTVAPARAEPRV
jgi:hypothetical protein